MSREFITTGSTASLRDVIEDVFASSSLSEAGKNMIEAENAEFYKGIILNCSSQYSAEGVIEAANIVIASFLRNKYVIDLNIPEISGSQRVPTIAEIENIVSGALYNEFSGSVDDWWGKKWTQVSGSVVTSGTFGEKWHEIFDPISGNLVTSGTFPNLWHKQYDPISGSLFLRENFDGKWSSEWAKVSGTYLQKGPEFNELWASRWDLKSSSLMLSESFDPWWAKKWNTFSGSLITSGASWGKSFSNEWQSLWNPIVSTLVLDRDFGEKWNRNWTGVSGSYIRGVDFDNILSTRTGSFIKNNTFNGLFDDRFDTKVSREGLATRDWISSSVPMRSEITNLLDSHSDFVRTAVTRSIEYSLSNSLDSKAYAYSRSFDAMKFAASISLDTISSSHQDWLEYRNEMHSFVLNQVTASREENQSARNNLIDKVNQVIEDSTIGTVQRNLAVIQGSLTQVQNSVTSLEGTVTQISGSITSQSLDMPNWQKTGGWITNDGTAYIDIDFESKNGWILNTVLELDDKGSLAPGPNFIMGRRISDDSSSEIVAITEDSSITVGYGTHRLEVRDIVSTKVKLGLKIYCANGDQTIIVDGGEYAHEENLDDPGLKSSTYIFAVNDVDLGSATASGNIKIYSLQVYSQKGTLIRDLWPAFDKKNNEACMYDYVSKEYFRNAAKNSKLTVSQEVIDAWN